MHRHILLSTALLLMVALPALALPPFSSLRPEMRPTETNRTQTRVSVSSQSSPLAVRESLRPITRGTPAPLRAAAPTAAAAPAPTPAVQGDFASWQSGFRGRAIAQDIQPETFDRAFSGVQVNTRILDRDNNQAEFSRTLWDYLDGAVSDARISNGRAALARHADALARIERRYGVEAEVVVAVWGLETAYGAMRGSNDIISAMATLAYEGRRRDFFEAELIAALRILQAGDVSPRQMVGSWAGAMGHTQFMPTSYLAHAVDFDGDGRRDIWSENPVDALASTANYLRHFGWTAGQPWGVEVVLPQGFDYSLTGEQTKRGAGFWSRQGVRLADGGQVPDHGQASILLPAGHRGVALMIFNNFHVIERYNPADAYVIGIGHLADRISGGGPFRAAWPREDRGMSRAERQELQQRLVARGMHTGAVDGIIGPQTADSVRRFQASVGLVPDGYPSVSLLQRLR